jgi:hypothetical protein
MDPRDEAPSGSKAGEQVGLGRVVRDDAAAPGRRPPPDEVEEALTDTFPASDPPSFSSGGAASDPGSGDVELPDPRDVP